MNDDKVNEATLTKGLNERGREDTIELVLGTGFASFFETNDWGDREGRRKRPTERKEAVFQLVFDNCRGREARGIDEEYVGTH